MARYKKPKKRNWAPREQRLVSEFIAEFYPEYESRTHVHLGSTPPRLRGRFAKPTDERLVGVFRRWADAIVIMPDRIVLIEAKILPHPGVLSQLKLYARLLPSTPELVEHKNKPIERVLLCAIPDPLLNQMCREEGVRVVIYRPRWITAYLKHLHPWERTPGLQTLE